MYREICRLTANWIQRRDIATTIEWATQEMGLSADRALLLWKTICEDHMRTGKNPKNVAWIMDQYEERIRGPKWDRHNRKKA